MTNLPKRVRQAVVIVHGMGEQRPLEMLNSFIDAAIPSKDKTIPGTDYPVYYSTPDDISNSYEARRYLAQRTDKYAQTEFFEYHWSHLMQGNKLSDIWTIFVRILLHPLTVPKGLTGLLVLVWMLILYLAWIILNSGLISEGITPEKVISTIVGGGLTGTVATWLILKKLPGKITASFVDVVRYLDTSPRSYAVRKKIRKGMIDLLQALHDRNRYQRIIVVAHSLGAYIAYDGISYLWIKMNQKHCADQNGAMNRRIINQLESIASKINVDGSRTTPEDVERFQEAQRSMWMELRKQGCPWLITDFITCGTPMYMADKLMTRNHTNFLTNIKKRHIATCPPQKDLPGPTADKTYFTYPYNYGRVIYHAAPFAVVRWTNMWFPTRWWFFGDWFGGRLGPLFGYGIKDIELTGNKPKRFIPAWAHTLYFKFPDDESDSSVTRHLHDAMELHSESWLTSTLDIPSCPTKKTTTPHIQTWLESVFTDFKKRLLETHGT